VPRPVRVGIAFWITIVLLGPAWGMNGVEIDEPLPVPDRVYNGVIDFSLALISEMLIGFVIGFMADVFLQTVGMAGEIMGQQAGFSAASVLDPITGQDQFLMTQIKILFATLIFICIGGPETVFMILADSFNVVHPGEGIDIVRYGEAGWRTMISDEGRRFALASLTFKVGIQLAGPMIGAMILVSVAEAFLARIVPQMNIMAVGFAIRISLSLLILFSYMPFFFSAFKNFLLKYSLYAHAMLSNMAPS